VLSPDIERLRDLIAESAFQKIVEENADLATNPQGTTR
jgi:hypothetical protein